MTSLVPPPDPASAHTIPFPTLTPLDLVMPRFYPGRWILPFALPLGCDNERIYEDLRIGLAHTVQSIPWLAAEIGISKSAGKSDGIELVDGPGGVLFKYKDLTSNFPTYKELKAERFPPSRLPSKDVAPLEAMPPPPHPVMAAQVSFIQGGMLLCIAMNHATCDGSAMYTVLEHWARNTSAAQQNTPFTTYDPVANDRSPLMEGDTSGSPDEFPEYRIQPETASDSDGVDISQISSDAFASTPMTSEVFRFSPRSLATIKQLASSYSTGDGLSAFVWRHMTIARNPTSAENADSADEEQTTALLGALSIRNRLSSPLPQAYLGNGSMVNKTEHIPISTLTSSSGLATGATAVRTSIKRFGSPSHVSRTLGFFQLKASTAKLSPAVNSFLGPDVVSTSLADLKIYDLVWGSYGSPEGFRLPGDGADGVFIIWPRLRDGSLEVYVALEESDMQRLRGDEDFVRFAESG